VRRAAEIRVGIVSRHRLIRDALRLLVAGEEGIAVVGDYGDAEERSANVILVDMPAKETEGFALLGAIQRTSPGSKVLVLAAGSDESLYARALRAGAKGCVSRDAAVSELSRAIRRVHEGEVWAKRRVLLRCIREDSAQGPSGSTGRGDGAGRLTAREREILGLLASGRTNKEIGAALAISEKTVKSHLGSIFRKLEVTGRVQAVLCAMRYGLG